MKVLRRLIGPTIIGLLLMLTLMPVSAQGNANVRFVHAIPGASAVDIYLNGTLVIADLGYGEATSYLTVPAGEIDTTVTAAGIDSSILWEQTLPASADTSTTFVASSADTLRFDAFNDNLGATRFGGTRLLLVHAVAGGPAVDVTLAEPVTLNGALQPAGTALATGMAYGTSFGAFDLPAQTYVVNVSVTGTIDTLVSNMPLPLTAGTSNIAIVYGTADAPQALLAEAPTGGEGDSGFVRFVHGAIGAPAVDVYVQDALIVPRLAAGSASPHLALPAGEHTVLLRAAGTEDEVLSGTITVSADEAQTVVALATDEGVSVAVFPDDLSGVTENNASVSVINALPDSQAAVALSNGVDFGTIEFGNSSQALAFTADELTVNYTLTIDTDTGTLQRPGQVFYGGTYYNVVVLAGDTFAPPSLLIAPTPLSFSLASGPGAGTITIAGDTGEATGSEVVTAPPAPEQPAPEQPAPPAATPAPPQPSGDVVTARVLTDPGANLHLRQYPDADALSLGLAPSGTVLEVVGREGGPVALVEGQEPPPEAEDYVDPATLLEDEDADLVPAETWLRVIYDTPDGGAIEAWVNAQLLDVRDEDGNLQRLADLPTFGGNVPGESRGTEITPPPIPEDRVTAVVFNLNPGISLNVRRTPSTDGEVLERLPNGTVTEFLGLIPADEEGNSDWVFINYTPPGGGSVTGWVSELYVRYEYNGRSIDLEEMEERELLVEADPEVRGTVRGGAQQATVPTPDPLVDAYVAEVQLDPTANLQFRRAPDAQSESLNLIPSDTRLIVEARNAAGDWLRATYEGQTGWIAAAFVEVTFNGRVVDILEIPLDPNFSTEPVATPTGNAG